MKVFLSYRREDSKWPTQRLAQTIARSAPETEVFIDIDSIPAGVDFSEHISNAVQSCDLLLVIIGRLWLTASADDGLTRRIDDDDDFVRIEIAEALARGIPVVPVLIDGAEMPSKAELPNEISELALRNAEHVQLRTFDHDVDRLLEKLRIKSRTKQGGRLAGFLSGSNTLALAAFAGISILVMAAIYWGLSSSTAEQGHTPQGSTFTSTKGTEPIVTDQETLEIMRQCDALAGHHLDRTLPRDIDGKTISEVREDPLAAQETCTKAVDAVPNSPRMHLNLSRAYFAGSEPNAGLEHVRRSAELGSLRALMSVGLRHVDGEAQAGQDFDLARDYFERADRRGEATARSALSRFAAAGVREPIDLEKAYRIGFKAAEEGYNRSRYNTGVRLANGIGVERDEELARSYFITSIVNPSITPLAHTQLGWMAENGIGGVPVNHGRALEHYQDGRKFGHRLASLALAKYYIDGEHVQRNIELGKQYLEEALRKDFYSIREDAFWVYEPNPHFDALTRAAAREIRNVSLATNDAELGDLVARLKSEYESRRIPIHEQIRCSDPQDRKSIAWCVGYWEDKPVKPLE
ncbi:MAG: toll/interleukin-1 receptor domain-containing protein [Henriciella sp.]